MSSTTADSAGEPRPKGASTLSGVGQCHASTLLFDPNNDKVSNSVGLYPGYSEAAGAGPLSVSRWERELSKEKELFQHNLFPHTHTHSHNCGQSQPQPHSVHTISPNLERQLIEDLGWLKNHMLALLAGKDSTEENMKGVLARVKELELLVSMRRVPLVSSAPTSASASTGAGSAASGSSARKSPSAPTDRDRWSPELSSPAKASAEVAVAFPQDVRALVRKEVERAQSQWSALLEEWKGRFSSQLATMDDMMVSRKLVPERPHAEWQALEADERERREGSGDSSPRGDPQRRQRSSSTLRCLGLGCGDKLLQELSQLRLQQQWLLQRVSQLEQQQPFDSFAGASSSTSALPAPSSLLCSFSLSSSSPSLSSSSTSSSSSTTQSCDNDSGIVNLVGEVFSSSAAPVAGPDLLLRAQALEVQLDLLSRQWLAANDTALQSSGGEWQYETESGKHAWAHGNADVHERVDQLEQRLLALERVGAEMNARVLVVEGQQTVWRDRVLATEAAVKHATRTFQNEFTCLSAQLCGEMELRHAATLASIDNGSVKLANSLAEVMHNLSRLQQPNLHRSPDGTLPDAPLNAWGSAVSGPPKMTLPLLAVSPTPSSSTSTSEGSLECSVASARLQSSAGVGIFPATNLLPSASSDALLSTLRALGEKVDEVSCRVDVALRQSAGRGAYTVADGASADADVAGSLASISESQHVLRVKQDHYAMEMNLIENRLSEVMAASEHLFRHFKLAPLLAFAPSQTDVIGSDVVSPACSQAEVTDTRPSSVSSAAAVLVCGSRSPPRTSRARGRSARLQASSTSGHNVAGAATRVRLSSASSPSSGSKHTIPVPPCGPKSSAANLPSPFAKRISPPPTATLTLTLPTLTLPRPPTISASLANSTSSSCSALPSSSSLTLLSTVAAAVTSDSHSASVDATRTSYASSNSLVSPTVVGELASSPAVASPSLPPSTYKTSSSGPVVSVPKLALSALLKSPSLFVETTTEKRPVEYTSLHR